MASDPNTADESRETRLENALLGLLEWRKMVIAGTGEPLPAGYTRKDFAMGYFNGPLWDIALEALA